MSFFSQLASLTGNPYVTLGLTLLGGASQKRASNDAAAAHRAVGEFNAKMEERNIGLIDKQIEITRRVRAIDEQEARYRFSTEVLGTVVNQYAGAGIAIGSGTPMRVSRQFAREFEVVQAKEDFNVSNRIMQMEDAKEDARLRAELSRMEGGYNAAAAKSAGTASMIQNFGQAARFGYENRAAFGIA